MHRMEQVDVQRVRPNRNLRFVGQVSPRFWREDIFCVVLSATDVRCCFLAARSSTFDSVSSGTRWVSVPAPIARTVYMVALARAALAGGARSSRVPRNPQRRAVYRGEEP